MNSNMVIFVGPEIATGKNKLPFGNQKGKFTQNFAPQWIVNEESFAEVQYILTFQSFLRNMFVAIILVYFTR